MRRKLRPPSRLSMPSRRRLNGPCNILRVPISSNFVGNDFKICACLHVWPLIRSVEESQPPYSYHPDNQLGEYPSPFSPFCPDSAPWKNMFTKLWNRSLGPSPTSTPGFRRGQVARWLSRNGCRSPWLTVRGTSHGIVSCSACVCVRERAYVCNVFGVFCCLLDNRAALRRPSLIPIPLWLSYSSDYRKISDGNLGDTRGASPFFLFPPWH